MPDEENDVRDAALEDARSDQGKFPAGIDDSGRAHGMEHGEDVDPSGGRSDHRPSVPGTSIPKRPASTKRY